MSGRPRVVRAVLGVVLIAGAGAGAFGAAAALRDEAPRAPMPARAGERLAPPLRTVATGVPALPQRVRPLMPRRPARRAAAPAARPPAAARPPSSTQQPAPSGRTVAPRTGRGSTPGGSDGSEETIIETG